MSEQKETIFAAGFVFKRPHETAPDFVKGSLSLKADEAVDFIKKHTKPDGWVNLDLLASKDNTKLYFKLNDWNPNKEATTEPSSAAVAAPEYPEGEINPEDIPF